MGKLKRIHAIALAGVMAVAIAVPVAIAQSKEAKDGGRQHHGMRGGHRMGGGFFRNLDLTDAQKAQMKQIRESHSQSVRPLMEQIRAKRSEIRQGGQGGAFNEALVAQKLNEIAPLEAKLMGERFRLHQEMLSVLTAEQKAKIEQSRSKWAERRANKQSAK